MFERLRPYPNALPILLSVMLVAVGYTISTWLTPPEGQATDLIPRLLLLAAMTLMMQDVLESAQIGARPNSWRNPNAWVYGFYMGYFWTVCMALLIWPDDPTPCSFAVTYAVGGTLFGSIMAFTASGAGRPLRDHHYDLTRSMTATRRGRVLYYGWPILLLAVVLSALIWPPQSPLIFVAVLVVGGAVCPLYPRPLGRSRIDLHTGLPRILGAACLIAALLGA